MMGPARTPAGPRVDARSPSGLAVGTGRLVPAPVRAVTLGVRIVDRRGAGFGSRARENPQMRMPFFVSMSWLLPALIACGGEPAEPTHVKVAAVQMLGYDKT